MYHAAPVVAFGRARSRRDGWPRLGLAPEGPRQRPEHRARLSHRTSHQLQQAKHLRSTHPQLHSLLDSDQRRKTYHPGDMVPFKWDLPVSLKQADLWIAYYGAVTRYLCGTISASRSPLDAAAWFFRPPTPYPGRTLPVTKEYKQVSAYDARVYGAASQSFIIQNK
ncbi:BZ3500_MvSof-1268-A1-R1_Chr5-2g07780 [Microbotryum saponariae]|uniref:BZ3500_MvSof-1268-A1-R1_Chr5-2g07780 protein n=1 Tax=Microbotryum saponariae TaxID=289078 RepID=A0A2X0KI33_9BASI|nr:BZ3500_MvSof-1268-A1-R1_Chr5-2g07780 [Microbotryum saponariae]SDA05649.1 BZ3501_MvSof-1269-A2-R1_Chr5-2g07602 [Microbotryum saponariae]